MPRRRRHRALPPGGSAWIWNRTSAPASQGEGGSLRAPDRGRRRQGDVLSVPQDAWRRLASGPAEGRGRRKGRRRRRSSGQGGEGGARSCWGCGRSVWPRQMPNKGITGRTQVRERASERGRERWGGEGKERGEDSEKGRARKHTRMLTRSLAYMQLDSP